MNEKSYDNDYLPSIIRWGRITNFAGILLAFGPALVLLAVFGVIPPLSAIVLLISILLVLGAKYKLYPAFVSTLGAVFASIAVGVFLHRKGLLE